MKYRKNEASTRRIPWNSSTSYKVVGRNFYCPEYIIFYVYFSFYRLMQFITVMCWKLLTIVLSESLPDPGHFPNSLSWHLLCTAVWQPRIFDNLLKESLKYLNFVTYIGIDSLAFQNPKGSLCKTHRMSVAEKILLQTCAPLLRVFWK